MAQHAFFFDQSRCVGCRTCVAACRDYHGLADDVFYRKVYEVTDGQTTLDTQGCFATTCRSYTISMSCNHCGNPACMGVCPTGAMHKSMETGIVSVDVVKCVGCGYCHMACPYNAPKVDRSLGHSVKCDGCSERLIVGLGAVCVEACPMGALAFDEVGRLARLGDYARVSPLAAPIHTAPNLLISPSDDALPSGLSHVKVANPLEVM